MPSRLGQNFLKNNTAIKTSLEALELTAGDKIIEIGPGKARGTNTIFTFEIDGVHIVHLGDLGEMLTDKEIDQLGTVDILFVPVGGTYTITAKQASELIPEIEPSVVIPMHYGRPDLDQKTFGELTPVETFTKLMGLESVVPQPKLSITKDKIPEQMQIVVLE
jgi:L-ascorbate metabolism protein UlaG (beta-lactamase superfamily)